MYPGVTAEVWTFACLSFMFDRFFVRRELSLKKERCNTRCNGAQLLEIAELQKFWSQISLRIPRKRYTFVNSYVYSTHKAIDIHRGIKGIHLNIYNYILYIMIYKLLKPDCIISFLHLQQAFSGFLHVCCNGSPRPPSPGPWCTMESWWDTRIGRWDQCDRDPMSEIRRAWLMKLWVITGD